ncbi:nucleolar DEAD-box protein required for synthesis of 60S ribosomal subunit [Orbilia oligospora]|uniref:RNA helicase n=1 Tax=Orbilia oligospora TaxID=2813651 RepID=A0A7C8U3V7_ORBOL|nr:nucleolar DEAD-box protein required for synthesis of 60S ribosomal subunit [Orbilia oligospora]
MAKPKKETPHPSKPKTQKQKQPTKVTIKGKSSPQPPPSLPPTKTQLRRQDDFVLTISDSDDIPDEESDIDAPSDDDNDEKNKESERLPVISKSQSAAEPHQRGKKRKREGEQANGGVAGGGANGHAQKKQKDEDIDSDFDFQIGDLDDKGADEFEGWGFEGAKSGMNEQKKGVDIDELIGRRIAKAGKAANGGAGSEDEDMEDDSADEASEEEEEEEEEEEDMVGKLLEGEEDSETEFGAAASSEDENEAEEANDGSDSDSDSDKEASDSDAESVLSEVPHPDDDGEEEEASDSNSDSETEETRAAKAAFFAPPTDLPTTSPTSTFQQMNLSRPILRGLGHINFTTPTAIQSRTIPIALLARDIVGGAVTGSGKTAAYMVPILERLLYRPKKVAQTRVVILTPTRELAIQVHSVAVKLAAFTDIKFSLAVGGLSLKAQEAELRQRPDIVIATPGRFIDHMRNSASFHTDGIEILVLDEADRMLEDGFADELDEILKTLPKSRQTMLFSATMTDSVDKLVRVGVHPYKTR